MFVITVGLFFSGHVSVQKARRGWQAHRKKYQFLSGKFISTFSSSHFRRHIRHDVNIEYNSFLCLLLRNLSVICTLPIVVHF